MLTLEVATADGRMTAQLFTPVGAGPWPAVVVAMDAAGLRPGLATLAQRVADGGYAVAVPDLFHRVGAPLALLPEGQREGSAFFAAFRTADAAFRAEMGKKMASASNPKNVTVDIGALLEALDARPEVKAGKAGLTGYCLGGGVALRAAADFPSRFGAIASFHGGGLATSAPDSPHVRIPEVKAELFFAGAEEDSSFTEEMQQRLRAALEATGSRFTLEVWAGARHGFSVPDSPAFRAEFGERHHVALQALLQRALG